MAVGKGKRPRDPNQLAAWTVAVSTGQIPALSLIHIYGIVRLASAQGVTLPAQADSKALNDFLVQRKAADPRCV